MDNPKRSYDFKDALVPRTRLRHFDYFHVATGLLASQISCVCKPHYMMLEIHHSFYILLGSSRRLLGAKI